jgi:hypothetical protein
MPTPRVSVVLAVHNGERFLQAALASVLGQSLQDFELIVVNDGSTDRSRTIVLGMQDARIRLLDNEGNLGLTPSLNRGLGEARGEFIARLDADDLAMPDRLARQVAFLDAHPDVALVAGGYRIIDVEARWQRRVLPPRDHVALRWELLFTCPFAHSAVMWRREAVAVAVGGYAPEYQYAMDWEFWARIASRLQLAAIPGVVALYRDQPESMTATSPRVPIETAMARTAALRFVLGGAAEPWVAIGPSLYAPFNGWPRDARAEQVTSDVDAMHRLSLAFAERLQLDEKGRRAHERFVRGWLARRLLIQARAEVLSGRRAHGGVLFDAAMATEPRVLFTSKGARYLIAAASRKGRSQGPSGTQRTG